MSDSRVLTVIHSWKFGAEYSKDGLNDAITEALGSLPHVETGRFLVTSRIVEFPISPLFANLRTLIFRSCPSRPANPPAALSSQLARLVAKCPKVEHLVVDIHDAPYRDRQILPTFRDILSGCSADEPLAIQRLELTGVTVTVDDVTLPHMRSLKSLKSNFYGALCPSPTQAKYTPFRGADDLHDLELDRIDRGQDNLIPPSGLKYLSLAWLHTQHDDDRLSDQFFSTILQGHAASLESLCIRPQEAGVWCYNEKMMPGIQRCTKLRVLAISIGDKKNVDEDLVRAVRNIACRGLYRLTSCVRIGRHPRCRNISSSSKRTSRLGRFIILPEDSRARRSSNRPHGSTRSTPTGISTPCRHF